MKNLRLRILFVLGLVVFSFFSVESGATDIRWNGFASFYARDSLSEDVRDNSADPNGIATTNDSKFGLNLRADIDSEWSAVGQLVVSQKTYGPSNETPAWSGEFDWFFLSYRNMNYGFEVKAGRQLFPSTLTAEYVDVGITYPWRHVPQQFAAISQFKSFEGASISRKMQYGDVNIDARFFGGNGKSNLQPSAAGNVDVSGLVGGLLSAEGEGWKVQTSWSHMDVSYKTPNYAYIPPAPTFAELKIPDVSMWFVGGKYDRGGLVSYAEYGTSKSGDRSARVSGYYGMVGYHVGRFLPHYTYSQASWFISPFFFDGTEVSHGYGLNYQVTPSIALKTEYLRQIDRRGAIFLSAANKWAESVSVGINAVF